MSGTISRRVGRLEAEAKAAAGPDLPKHSALGAWHSGETEDVAVARIAAEHRSECGLADDVAVSVILMVPITPAMAAAEGAKRL